MKVLRMVCDYDNSGDHGNRMKVLMVMLMVMLMVIMMMLTVIMVMLLVEPR